MVGKAELPALLVSAAGVTAILAPAVDEQPPERVAATTPGACGLSIQLAGTTGSVEAIERFRDASYTGAADAAARFVLLQITGSSRARRAVPASSRWSDRSGAGLGHYVLASATKPTAATGTANSVHPRPPPTHRGA